MNSRTTVAIVGGGPAGMMLGLLLARRGIAATVLEKHGDFLRDFRGDTVHPPTLDLIDELGLTAKFEAIPQGKLQDLLLRQDLRLGSLAELHVRHPYIAIAPQWDFLNLLADEGRRYPEFRLEMDSEVIDIVRENGAIAGVRYRSGGQEHVLHSLLTIAADGRHSRVREAAGLPTREFGVPFDVLWFRLPKPEDEHDELFFRVAPHRWIVGFDRRTYVQMAFVIRKGARDEVFAAGIDAFRRAIVDTLPELRDRVAELKSFDDVKFLEVRVNRAPRWQAPGLLMIGDAAHAMSPIGGVGVNYAVQDAVAAANILAAPLLRAQHSGTPVPERYLRAVQRRRELPAAIIQRLQLLAQDHLIQPALEGEVTAIPKFARVLQRVGIVRRMLMRLMAIGIRPEHLPATERVSSRARSPAAAGVRRTVSRGAAGRASRGSRAPAR